MNLKKSNAWTCEIIVKKFNFLIKIIAHRNNNILQYKLKKRIHIAPLSFLLIWFERDVLVFIVFFRVNCHVTGFDEIQFGSKNFCSRFCENFDFFVKKAIGKHFFWKSIDLNRRTMKIITNSGFCTKNSDFPGLKIFHCL